MRKTLAAGVITILLHLGAATPLKAQMIQNAFAEAGAAAPDSVSIVAVPGWETTGGFTVVAYGTPGPFPVVPPIDGQVNNQKFFTGGPGSPISTATQIIPIPESLWMTFEGPWYLQGSADIGGWATSTAAATVVFSLLDTAEVELCSFAIGPVTPEHRSGQTGFDGVEGMCSIRVPPESRFVRVLIRIDGPEGAYNSGFVDNIFLNFAWPDPVLPTTWSQVKARAPGGP